MPCAGLRGLLGGVRAPAPLEARCSGKRRSPAISIPLSTKHWRYRHRKFRGADRALPAGAEECARARPRLGVNEGTNDCDTRRPGLVHADAPPHRIDLLVRIAAGVVTSGQWFRHAEQGLTGVVFHIRSAILVRIGRVDRLPPDRALLSERKLRIALRSRLAQVPTRLAGSKTIKATFFLEAWPLGEAGSAHAAVDAHTSKRLCQWLCRKHNVKYGGIRALPG